MPLAREPRQHARVQSEPEVLWLPAAASLTRGLTREFQSLLLVEGILEHVKLKIFWTRIAAAPRADVRRAPTLPDATRTGTTQARAAGGEVADARRQMRVVRAPGGRRACRAGPAGASPRRRA